MTQAYDQASAVATGGTCTAGGLPAAPETRVVPIPAASLCGQCLRITVRVQNGVADLDGVVSSADVRVLVRQLVLAVSGVRDVSGRPTLGARL